MTGLDGEPPKRKPTVLPPGGLSVLHRMHERVAQHGPHADRQSGSPLDLHAAKTRRVIRPLISFLLVACIAALNAPSPGQAKSSAPDNTLVLSGTVCAQATGMHLAGAQVGAQGRWTTTGPDGRYSLTLLPAKYLPIRAAAQGYQSTDVVTVYDPSGSTLSGKAEFSLCGRSGLAEAFRSSDGSVRLASFAQAQPGTPHTIVVSGTSSVSLEAEAALLLPSGKVTLISLRRSGTAIHIAMPLVAGPGRYLLEINAAAGFALIKLPIYAGIGYKPPAAPAPYMPDPKGATIAQLRSAALSTVNRLRGQASLPPLQTGVRLNAVSQEHSDDMARHGYVGHPSFSGLQPFQRIQAAHIDFTEMAEDVGSGDSIQGAIDGLMDSPAHRWAVLGNFRVVGIGISMAQGKVLMTLDFVR
ncbi:MAG: hypothetical protein JWO59_1981 [Chloroflexi bacterium]|nr:hypothetical protein [Chloroflexota bacterium]